MKNLVLIFALLSSLFAFGQVQDICFGEVKTYSVDLPSGTPGSTYDWTISSPGFAGTITGNGSYTIDIDWATTPPGTYTLQVIETNNDCPGEPQLLTINVHPLPVEPTINNNSDICFDDTAEFYFNGEPNLTVNYDLNGTPNFITLDANGLATLDIPNATQDQNLVITSVSNTFGCTIDTNIPSTVVVNALPNIPTYSNNGPICFDETAEFTLSAGPNEVIDYTINGVPGSVTADATGNVMISVPNAQSNQQLVLTQITNPAGCSITLSETSEVVVNALPTEPTITNNSAICAGETAIFNLEGEAGDVIDYVIDGNQDSITLDGNGFGTITLPNATADVVLTIQTITNTNNCSISSSLMDTVVVNPLPTTPTLSSNSPICFDETAEFYITGTPGDTVTYILNGVQNTVVLDPNGDATITVPNAQADQVMQLTQVDNGFGCSISVNLTETVVVAPMTVTSPINFN